MQRLPLVLLVLLMPALQARLIALEPKEIFENVSLSTVVIEDVDVQGSGVVISDKGLILTNYHVVAANIDLKIRARVRFGDKVVLTDIGNVKLVKIHPTYDIALLE